MEANAPHDALIEYFTLCRDGNDPKRQEALRIALLDGAELREITADADPAIIDQLVTQEQVYPGITAEALTRYMLGGPGTDKHCYALIHTDGNGDDKVLGAVYMHFSHPAIQDDRHLANNILDILHREPQPIATPTLAAPYSVSNAIGLSEQYGITTAEGNGFFVRGAGDAVISRAVRALTGLSDENPALTVSPDMTIATLSPLHGFALWLTQTWETKGPDMLTEAERTTLEEITTRHSLPADPVQLYHTTTPADFNAEDTGFLRELYGNLAATYLLTHRDADRPKRHGDLVTNFHIKGDRKAEGFPTKGGAYIANVQPEAYGDTGWSVMVNYGYTPLAHAAMRDHSYVSTGTLSVSPLLLERFAERQQQIAPEHTLTALPELMAHYNLTLPPHEQPTLKNIAATSTAQAPDNQRGT